MGVESHMVNGSRLTVCYPLIGAQFNDRAASPNFQRLPCHALGKTATRRGEIVWLLAMRVNGRMPLLGASECCEE